MRTITFNELRRIKDSLPSGSMHRIADELNMTVETVRNFFGGHNFKNGKSVGIHLEPGPDGGLVMLDDTTVLEKALQILRETEEKVPKNSRTVSASIFRIQRRIRRRRVKWCRRSTISILSLRVQSLRRWCSNARSSSGICRSIIFS